MIGRVKKLNNGKTGKEKFVLYWIQASPRAEINHALEYAIATANTLKLPIICYFGLAANYPMGNQRNFTFLLEGLRELEKSLKKKGIKLIVRIENPVKGVLEISKEAAVIITDRGYLHNQIAWRSVLAEKTNLSLIQVETNVVVPIEVISPKAEYTAGTLRPKLKKHLEAYLVPLKEQLPILNSLGLKFDSLKLNDIDSIIEKLNLDKSVKPSDFLHGGTSNAKKLLKSFIDKKLKYYDELRNDPSEDYQSNLSPYLHFGQISPLHVALEAMKSPHPAKEAFLEELIIRRELSMNYVFYSPFYDSFEVLPDWAKTTLKIHEQDPREYVYSLEEFEEAKTHDKYWNAAQKEMIITGKMHGYMRMYWGKKILEWTHTSEEAIKIALYLNDKYELDGRDPNSYAGVLWCFGKHDRAWSERPIFGKVRYMNTNGLKRKFDIDKYVKKVEQLAALPKRDGKESRK